MSNLSLSIFFILISACSHACFNAVLKTGVYRVPLRAMVSWFASLIFLPIILFAPLPKPETFFVLCCSAFVHCIYQLCQAQSLHHTDISVGYSITRGISPIMTALISMVVLNVSIPFGAWLGIILVSISIFFMIPRKKFEKISDYQGVLWSLLTGVLVSCYTLVDGYGSRFEDNVWIFIAWFFPFNSLGSTIVSLLDSKTPLKIALKFEYKRAILAACCALISYTSVIFAFRHAGDHLAQVSTIRETSIIFGAFIAWYFFKEHVSKQKWLAIVGIMAGCFIIKNSMG